MSMSILTVALTIASDLSDFGGSTYIARRMTMKLCSTMCLQRLLIKKMMFLTLISIFFIIYIAKSELNLKLVIGIEVFLLLLFHAYVFTFQQIARAYADFNYMNIGNLLERFSWLAIYLFYKLGVSGTVSLFSAMLCGAIVHSCLAFKYFKSLEKVTSPVNLCVFTWHNYKDLGISAIITDVALLDSPLISIMMTSHDAAMFVGISRIKGSLALGYASASHTLPSWHLQNTTHGNLFSWYRSVWPLISLNSVGLFLLVIFPQTFIVHTLGIQYLGASTLLIIFAIATFPSTIIIPISLYFTYVSETKIAKDFSFIHGALFLICISIGAITGKAVGASLGYLLAQILSASACIILLLRSQNQSRKI